MPFPLHQPRVDGDRLGLDLGGRVGLARQGERDPATGQALGQILCEVRAALPLDQPRVDGDRLGLDLGGRVGLARSLEAIPHLARLTASSPARSGRPSRSTNRV